MDENKIRQIVREEINRNHGNSRFSLQSIPKHTHNGVDSVFVVQPTQTYIGLILGGTVDPVEATVLLPKGWKLDINTTVGPTTYTYVITHNLSSSQGGGGTVSKNAIYAVAIQINEADLYLIFAPSIQENADEFTVNFRQSTGGSVAPSFTFSLTVINNRSLNPPSYYGALLV